MRNIIRGLLAATLGSLIGMTTQTQAQTHLTIMVFPSFVNLPLFAAQSQGFFANRGISVDVKFAPNSDELRNGLAEGRFQLGHTAVDNGVAMVEMAKLDVVVFMGGDDGGNHLVVRPEIGSVADLRGKTVLVDAPNTAYAFLLYAILKKNGLTKGVDYKLDPVGGTPLRLTGMQEGRGVAGMLNPPFLVMAKTAGLKDLGSAAALLGPYQAGAGFTMRAWATQNGETLANYIRAYLEGLRWAFDPKNKSEAIKLYVERLKLSQDVAEASYEAAVGATASLDKDARLDLEGFRNVLRLRAEFEGGTPAAPEKYIDLSWYEKARAVR
jgi:ABC-type nitrate/sulfonate/bicarbonate transport system substrate-binding protein